MARQESFDDWLRLVYIAQKVRIFGEQTRPLASPPPSPIWRLGDLRFWTFREWGTLQAAAVGSRCTCSPPPTGTDQDWLAVAPSRERHQQALWGALEAAGWERCGDHPMERGEDYPEEFEAWRLGDDNLIVALHRDFRDRFMVASHLARRLNLLEKADRIALFQAVLYGRGEGA